MSNEVMGLHGSRLITIHQVRLRPLVGMMFTEVSAPLASNKCLPVLSLENVSG